ncbi:NB-ARC domain-containing protein [Brevibacillus panacihumi]|uniref:AAA family ATPase n=1 Tax=Brevibacillus panacihumi TaxID=497735 RepID=A0A3M8C402_9BACL|nr:NB-ARC domain-containing protein [Brevibacillus panacihumi]RNB70408.1 AAA family ATPase [Brevibacillus panacihumi]
MKNMILELSFSVEIEAHIIVNLKNANWAKICYEGKLEMGVIMQSFNLSTRIIMFSICTSFEYDLKRHILGSNSKIEYTADMISKVKFRNPKIDIENDEDVLNQLDLGDFIYIITSNPFNYKINNEKAKILQLYFEKLIPVRNRVMHTKPLELGDRAILIEFLDDIDRKINWINWNETINTRSILNEDPSKLVIKKYIKVIEYNPDVYHNLPDPEFDDTGYIGRKKEVNEIKELVKNRKNQIITIIGNGGIGKTAIAVKTLYELIDDANNDFEAIIWISLKTKTLSKGEFKLIENSVNDISKLYVYGEKNIIADDSLSPKENLLNFMEHFKVLLVIDNLETINNEEINVFIKEIPEKSKLLITSRHGIGELEYRYNLDGMNAKDAITYFRELSKYFGLDLYKKSDQEIKTIVNEYLYSSPLSIKWFISGIFNGLDESSLLANKDELVEFCMSNVYQKLSTISKKILQLFLIENKELSLGEIDYFLETNDVVLRQSINELLSTNMIKLASGNYSLNDMARDYLSLYHAPDNEFVISTFSKRKVLNNILQDIKVKNENDPFHPRSLFANLENENRKLASFYLSKALESSSRKSWEESLKFVDKAANISPDYFEVYKIKAYILAEKMELFNALTNYQIALEKCEGKFERATILLLFAVFYVIKMYELEKALELILEAESYRPNEVVILLEKSRILMYLGKYDDAEAIMEKINMNRADLNLKMENVLASRYADLFKRRAEKFELRDARKKLSFLKRGIEEIEKVSKIDTKSYLTMVNLLKEISSLYFDEEAMVYLASVLKTHFSHLKSINHRNLHRMNEYLISRKHEIPKDLYTSLEKYIYDFKLDANKINEDHIGIIVFIRDHFGFIANAKNKSLYFNIQNIMDDSEVGDKVEFEIYSTPRGPAAKNIRRVQLLEY